MKIKNKGKVYPSPSSASSPETDALSVLNLLPAAILALASLLSLEDREVLAYLITRSLKTTTNTTQDPKKKSSKKPTANSAAAPPHKPPVFECDCFDCYTSFWFRWDSSPNRELINQAIEAFEDHLANGEITKKTTRSKRRDKTIRRADVPVSALAPPDSPSPMPEIAPPEVPESFPVSDLSPSPPPDSSEICEEESKEVIEKLPEVVVAAEEKLVMVVKCSAASTHKGLARKVLPDVLGLFNSRLWSLWNPNV